MALLVLAMALLLAHNVEGLGVNYGTLASHLLPPKSVVQMLKANSISKVKLFDADFNTVRAFANTGIEVMVAIPNDMLQTMASDTDAANRWVKRNVSRYLFDGGVNIKYVAVGNEPFLKAYNGSFQNVTLPATINIQRALERQKIADRIKVTVPLNADVLSNGGVNLPSAGIFRPDIQDAMTDLVSFLAQKACPFTVNLYPFLSLQQDPNFPKEFAFFDGSAPPTTDGPYVYTNVFDASYDLLVSALRKNGFGNMSIIVGEVGWPTDGDINANIANAQRFYKGMLSHINMGTPLTTNQPLDVYLFSLTDEDRKSIAPGNFERHWGIYGFDGQSKYEVELNPNRVLVNASGIEYLPRRWCVLNPDADRSKLADNVDYACTHADCTPLTFGGSCNGIGSEANASYAFNSYYQLNNQVASSCGFQGLARVTTQDPSLDTCQFKIGIVASSALPRCCSPHATLYVLITMALTLLF